VRLELTFSTSATIMEDISFPRYTSIKKPQSLLSNWGYMYILNITISITRNFHPCAACYYRYVIDCFHCIIY
jgi:hypothetical protein